MQANQPNVLIVDDERQIAELISEALRSRGFRCQAATSAAQAAAILEEQSFDVLVVDICMPYVNGLELLTYVRESAPDTKVILMSGVSSTHNLAKALSLGAYDYFQKPLDLVKLASVVADAAGEGIAAVPLPIRAARAMRFEAQVIQASLESIAAFVRAVEAKDPYTKSHSEQVAHYATNLAVFLKLSDEMVDSIRTAALLHDIGKIGVPDRVLTKPGPLTDEEFELIRRHPALGAEILENISLLAFEATLIRAHHENWDGSGYPDGLAGEDIPFGSRIINIADAMDAMLMKRTYKLPYPAAKMIDELDRCAGAQFDPALARRAIQWCGRHQDQMILPSLAA